MTRWTVSQIGAREHYLAPRALARRGRLRLFYTDAWCGAAATTTLRRGPKAARAFAGRHTAELPPRAVVRFTARTLLDEVAYAVRRRLRPNPSWHPVAIEIGRKFAL